MEIYSIENLTFCYSGSNTNTLKNVTFSVNSGEFITICGLSGSGKSTLLRQLKTCLKPCGKCSGKIYFEGNPLGNTDFETQSRKIGFVMQSPDNQSVTDKVWHELSFGLESLSLDTKTIRKRVAETASFFGIEKWLEKSIDSLSGGQKQLLNLASVMIMQPTVLILDEPTAQLDPIAAEEFISVLRKINTELGTTVMLSEHNLNDVFSVSNRIIVMSDGEIISDETPQNTGKKLYEQKNKMFSAMPSPVRIFSVVEDNKNEAPLTVSDGRKWLASYVKNTKLRQIEDERKVHHTEPPVLEMKDIRFRYERNLPDVLCGTNLKAYRGEFLAILGGNGTGKSTMLSVISGINKPYSGKVYINSSNISKDIFGNGLAMLPQNPQTLFIKNTVEEDLYDIFFDKNLSSEIQKQRVENIISLCGLEEVRMRHPYDLSGGEQQKAALAKVLLTNPKILLLDEPTKGLDTDYKKKFADIIKTLILNDTTVITVSHDIEFCAEYADRCAMFFNGEIVSENTPRAFFADNNFYTTSSSRMSRGIIENAVTEKDILYAVGKECPKDTEFKNNIKSVYDKTENKNISEINEKTKKRLSLKKIIMTVISLVIFIFSSSVITGMYNLSDISGNNKILPYILIFVSIIMLIITFGKSESKNKVIPPPKDKLSKRTKTAAVMSLLAIPVTILIGVYCFDNTKYLFISLLVMFESMFPFFLMFEKRNIRTRETVLIAALCALCISGRIVFYILPQFKPVTALVIISGIALGGETGFLVGAVTMLISNMFFGQGAWTPWQMFAMGIIGFLAGVIYNKRILPQNRISISIFGFISALLIYGVIMNLSSLIISQSEINISAITAFYISGLPMDIIHALSTAIFLFIGAEPILDKLERVKIKYFKYENY